MATGLDPRPHIAASPLLGRLPDAAIDQLAAQAESLGLRGGETLFEAEEPADALYLVTRPSALQSISSRTAGLAAVSSA